MVVRASRCKFCNHREWDSVVLCVVRSDVPSSTQIRSFFVHLVILCGLFYFYSRIEVDEGYEEPGYVGDATPTSNGDRVGQGIS